MAGTGWCICWMMGFSTGGCGGSWMWFSLTREDVEDCAAAGGESAGAAVGDEGGGGDCGAGGGGGGGGAFPAADVCGRWSARPVWLIRRRLGFGGVDVPKRPVVFCGIARPEGFLGDAGGGGCGGGGYGDLWGSSPVWGAGCGGAARRAAEVGADGFVTTEKDAVKLTRADAGAAGAGGAGGGCGAPGGAGG